MGKTEERLLKRLIFLWGEASDLANDPAIANKRHREYVKLRSIYYKKYISEHPPTDDEFDRVIARASRAESERKYMEGLAERERKYNEKRNGMTRNDRLQKKLDSLWQKVSFPIDDTSKEYKNYERLRKRLAGKSEPYDDNVEELPSRGDWPEPSRQRIGDIEL